MQSNPQSNPVFWNGFQIQVQSTKKECNQDFAILQSQSYRCLMGSAQVDVGVSDDKDKVILQIVFSTTSPISI